MAVYDDRKKKPLDGPQLIPGTPAAAIAGAVNNVRNNYQATQQAAGKVNLAKNLRFINPADPRSMVARPSNRGLAPAPQPAAVASPAVAQPGASSTQARASAGAPSQVMTLNEADAREKAAASARPMPSPTVPATGAGAPLSGGAVAAPTFRTGDGRNAPLPAGVAVVRQRNGVNAFGATGQSVASAQGAMGSVNRQSFGGPTSIARPGAGVASTFGMGVSDPRLDDQIARPTVPGAVTGGFRNPDSRSEFYNNKEDREAARKLAGDMDTDIFRASFAAGRPGRQGRQAQDQIASLRGAQASILSGQAGRSADAVQGGANRTNQFDIANMGEMGEQRRAELQAMVARDGQQVTREGQQLGYDANIAKVNADAIQRPTLRTDANGNLLSVDGTSATNVVGADGQPVREAQTNVGGVDPRVQVEQMRTVNELAAQYLGADPMTGKISAGDAERAPNADEIAAARAWATQQISGGVAAPQAGVVKNGYRFRGGNPADKANWERVK